MKLLVSTSKTKSFKGKYNWFQKEKIKVSARKTIGFIKENLLFQQGKTIVPTSKNRHGSRHEASQITCFFDSRHQFLHKKAPEQTRKSRKPA